MDIKKARHKKQISQSKLAQKLGISQNYLSELENNKFDIKLSLVMKISSILDVCVCDLVECNCKKCRKNRSKT